MPSSMCHRKAWWAKHTDHGIPPIHLPNLAFRRALDLGSNVSEQLYENRHVIKDLSDIIKVLHRRTKRHMHTAGGYIIMAPKTKMGKPQRHKRVTTYASPPGKSLQLRVPMQTPSILVVSWLLWIGKEGEIRQTRVLFETFCKRDFTVHAI